MAVAVGGRGATFLKGRRDGEYDVPLYCVEMLRTTVEIYLDG